MSKIFSISLYLGNGYKDFVTRKVRPLLMAAILGVVVGCTLTSCMTTKTSVGSFNQEQGDEYKYAKSKQVWLVWGLIPLGRTDVSTPRDGNCEVITRLNVIDFFVNTLTGGFVRSRTIKVKAKRDSED